MSITNESCIPLPTSPLSLLAVDWTASANSSHCFRAELKPLAWANVVGQQAKAALDNKGQLLQAEATATQQTTDSRQQPAKCYAHKSRPVHRNHTKETKRATQMAKNDKNFTASQLWPVWHNRLRRTKSHKTRMVGRANTRGGGRGELCLQLRIGLVARQRQQQHHRHHHTNSHWDRATNPQRKAKVVTVLSLLLLLLCCCCCCCRLCCNQNARLPCDW